MLAVDDYILAAAVAVMVTSALVMAVFLARYAKLVREADRSTRLAKDVWESMNARFSVIDTRIIDLMAKSEVLSSRMAGSQQTAPPSRAPSAGTVHETPLVRTLRPEVVASPTSLTTTLPTERTDTETRVLQMLAEGPKSSAEIKGVLGRSREHTARLMKGLFDRGLVARNDRNKPYVYEITEAGRSYIVS